MPGSDLPHAKIPGVPTSWGRDLVVADGDLEFTNIQDAVDAADSSVIVGPGTYDESVLVEKDGLTIRGVGQDATIINGGVGSGVFLSGTNLHLRDMTVNSDPGGNNSAVFVTDRLGQTNHSVSVTRVTVNESGSHGIHADGATNTRVTECTLAPPSGGVISQSGIRYSVNTVDGTLIGNFTSAGVTDDGIAILSDNTTVFGNQCFNGGRHGVNHIGDDGLVGFCRVGGFDNIGVRMAGTDQAVDMVRCSDNGTDFDAANATNLSQGIVKTGAAN